MYRKWEKNVPTHWPSEITFGKLFFKNNWDYEKKKGLQYKYVNLSINYNHEKLEAIQGALGEGWEVSTHSLQLLEWKQSSLSEVPRWPSFGKKAPLSKS